MISFFDYLHKQVFQRGLVSKSYPTARASPLLPPLLTGGGIVNAYHRRLILLESSIFTQEYQSGTLVLTLTKGFERYKVVIAKSLMPVNSSALLNGVGEASLYWSSIAVTALLCVVFAVLSVMALSQKQLQEGTGDK